MAVTLQDCEPLLIDQVLRDIVQDLKSSNQSSAFAGADADASVSPGVAESRDDDFQAKRHGQSGFFAGA